MAFPQRNEPVVGRRKPSGPFLLLKPLQIRTTNDALCGPPTEAASASRPRAVPFHERPCPRPFEFLGPSSTSAGVNRPGERFSPAFRVPQICRLLRRQGFRPSAAECIRSAIAD